MWRLVDPTAAVEWRHPEDGADDATMFDIVPMTAKGSVFIDELQLAMVAGDADAEQECARKIFLAFVAKIRNVVWPDGKRQAILESEEDRTRFWGLLGNDGQYAISKAIRDTGRLKFTELGN